MKKYFDKKYKALDKYYKNELARISATEGFSVGIDYFVTHLRYMRDSFIMNDEALSPDKNFKLASISTAIAAYENYANCFDKYYSVKNGVPEAKDKTKSKEDITKEFNEERTGQWVLFWQLVMTNLEGWVANDAVTL